MAANYEETIVLLITTADNAEHPLTVVVNEQHVISATHGETYRFVRVINGKQLPLEYVIASGKNDDLQLLFTEEKSVLLKGYFEICGNNECQVQLSLREDNYFILPADSISLNRANANCPVFVYDDSQTAMEWAADQCPIELNAVSDMNESNSIHIVTLATLLTGGVAATVMGSGGGNSANSAAMLTTIVSGLVSAGEVQAGNDLLVVIYDSNGNILGSSPISAGGEYSVEIPNDYYGPIVVRVQNEGTAKDYKHEGTGEDEDLSVDLRAVTSIYGNGHWIVNISPITELSARKIFNDEGASNAESNVKLPAEASSETIAAWNRGVAKALGLSAKVDIIKDKAIAVNDDEFPASSENSQALGFLLAALAGAETAGAKTTDDILQGIASAIDFDSLSQAQKDILLSGALIADKTEGNYRGVEQAFKKYLLNSADIALMKIIAFIQGSADSAPDELDYLAIGVAGVTAANIHFVNEIVAIKKADTAAEINKSIMELAERA